MSSASCCHSRVFLSSSSGTHVAFPTILIVPATSQSLSQMPGVVGRCVVVVVVDVVVVEDVLVVGTTETLVDETVAVLAASRSFSIDIGVVEGAGQPVNSVVALREDERQFFTSYFLVCGKKG